MVVDGVTVVVVGAIVVVDVGTTVVLVLVAGATVVVVKTGDGGTVVELGVGMLLYKSWYLSYIHWRICLPLG